MRAHVVDPSAYTPPYDHALCAALAKAGAEVELFTSRFAHGAAPAPVGYSRREFFYRRAASVPWARARSAAKLAAHVPGMLAYRRAAAAADVVHFQWLPVQPLDAFLLPRSVPVALTAHDVLPREPRPGQRAAQGRLYGRVDAVVVHSEHGRERLCGELGLDPARVRVIPHGVLRPWEGLPAQALPHELAGAEARPPLPVVLMFGLLRPYKGIDVLLEAWRGIEGAELWIVGMPRMDIGGLRASAPSGVRWLTRFVGDGELRALMERATLAVLPYREIDHSGVAFTALGAGLPLVLSDAGGFPELAASGAARTFPAGDVAALHELLRSLLGDPSSLAAMAQAAGRAAAGEYSWDAIARRTLSLYEELLARA